VATLLNEAHADYALVGGYAIAAHGFSRQRYIETVDLDGIPLRVLNLEGLLLTKQGDRPKDQMDASILRQALAILKSGET
jgi:hypothetical protein